MSGRCTGWVLEYGPRPDGSITLSVARRWRAVLGVIADAANADGRNAHPGLDNMVSHSLYSRSSVLATVDELIDAGWIVRTARNAPGRASTYDVCMDRDPALAAGAQVQNEDQSQVQEPDLFDHPTGPEIDVDRSRNGAQQVQNPPGTHTVTSTVVLNGSSAPAVAGAGPVLSPLGRAQAARTRTKDPVWDALMAACRIDSAQIPRSARGAYNRAVADLRAIEAGPDDIVAKAAAFRRTWPTVSLTPTALVRRWGELDDSPQLSRSTNALLSWAAES